MSNHPYAKRIRIALSITLSALMLLSIAACNKTNESSRPILIMYAFSAEGELLAKKMQSGVQESVLGRSITVGKFNGHDVVLAESGIGMTNAAMTAQMLIDRFNPSKVIFSGIAGAIDSSVHIGDIVVCEKWATHDYGYIGKDGLIPGDIDIYSPVHDSVIEQIYINTDSSMLAVVRKISGQELILDPIGKRIPEVIIGGVGVSGNTFIDSREKRRWLSKNFSALVTDMESAAVAQVCAVNGIPFIVFRSASDLAGGSGSESATAEIKQFFRVAARNSARVVLQFLDEL